MQSVKEPKQFQRIMVPTLIYMTCMMITGIIGNVVVCIVYYKKFRHCSVRYYILVMGVVNLFTCVVVMPMEFVFQLRYDLDVSEWECKAVMFVKAGVVGFSGYLLIIVAIDRYRKVCKPTKKQFNEKKAIGVCAFMTILTTVPTMFFTGRNTVYFEGTNVTGLTCFVADDVVGSAFLMKYAWSMVVSLCIGSMVMSVAYVQIARYLLKHKKHMEMYWIHKSKPGSTISRNTMSISLHINAECPAGAIPEACLSSAVDAIFLNSPRGPPRTTALSSDISPSPACQRTQGQMPLSTGLASTTQTHGGPSQIQPTLESEIGGNEANILCGTSRKGAVEDVRVPEIEATCITTSAGKGEKAEKTATEPADGRQDAEPKTLSRCQSSVGQSSQSQNVDGFAFIIKISSMDKLAHTKAGDTEQKQTEIADKHSGKVTESAKGNTSALSDKKNSTMGLGGSSSAVDAISLVSLEKNSLTTEESKIAKENKNVMSDEIIITMEKDRLLTGTEQLQSASDSTDTSEKLDRGLSWSDAHAQLEPKPCLTTSEGLQVSTPMSRPIPELQVQRGLSGHLRTDQVKSLSQSVSRIPTHTTLMLYILTAVFLFNFLPYLSVLIIYGGRDIRYNMFQICVKSYCINCSVNPVIYGFCSAKFRRECFKLFTFRFKFEDNFNF